MSLASLKQMLDHPESEQFELEVTGDADRIVYAHDLAGNFTFLNKTGELVFGFSARQARQMNITQVVTPEFIGHLHKQIAHMLSERPGLVFEIDVIGKDGRRVALEVSTQPILRDGRPIEIRGIAVPSVLRSGLEPPSKRECLCEDFVTFCV
ncbi:MAG: PAS domain S-box protein [Acidobacteriota bacterium]